MPIRRKDLPTTSLSSTFRAKLTREQDKMGWSDVGLAKRASEYYPVAPSAIWKLKNADPPRRVDIDEADAIARAFGYDDVAGFLARADEHRVEMATGPVLVAMAKVQERSYTVLWALLDYADQAAELDDGGTLDAALRERMRSQLTADREAAGKYLDMAEAFLAGEVDADALRGSGAMSKREFNRRGDR